MKVTKGGTVSKLLKDVEIPAMFHARQTFPRETIAPEDIPAVVEREIAQPHISEKIKPGMSIAITAGSRGTHESGPCKMMTVGLGKQVGAQTVHSDGMGNIAKNIPTMAEVVLEKAPTTTS